MVDGFNINAIELSIFFGAIIEADHEARMAAPSVESVGHQIEFLRNSLLTKFEQIMVWLRFSSARCSRNGKRFWQFAG